MQVVTVPYNGCRVEVVVCCVVILTVDEAPPPPETLSAEILLVDGLPVESAARRITLAAELSLNGVSVAVCVVAVLDCIATRWLIIWRLTVVAVESRRG